jgi:hypothetical protein
MPGVLAIVAKASKSVAIQRSAASGLVFGDVVPDRIEIEFSTGSEYVLD